MCLGAIMQCKTCKNYKPDEELFIGFGDCSMMGDVNDYSFVSPHTHHPKASKSRCYGWDAEGYSAGCWVGEEFGCIHYGEKSNATK